MCQDVENPKQQKSLCDWQGSSSILLPFRSLSIWQLAEDTRSSRKTAKQFPSETSKNTKIVKKQDRLLKLPFFNKNYASFVLPNN